MYRLPDIDDKNLMSKIYKKKEFYDNKADKPFIPSNNKEKAKYIQTKCHPISYDMQKHQALLSNIIHPNTPYTGLLVYHGLGTGKTCAAIAVAENFKEQVLRYQTKVYIIVPGKDVRETWKKEILDICGKNIYLNTGKNKTISQLYTASERKKAMRKVNEVYRIITYDKLRRMVIGEKTENLQGEKVYRLDNQNLQKLDNSLIIVDEAHNIAGSERGKALNMLIKNSSNLRVLLLTATPMRNLAEDIIPLLNLLKPADQQINKEDVFEKSEKVLDIKLKPQGLEILKLASRGYVSYFKSSNPILYPKIREMGNIVPGLEMQLYKCQVKGLQKDAYITLSKTAKAHLTSLDSLAKAQAYSNFVFPILGDDNKKLIGISTHKGLIQFRNQMRQKPELLKKKIMTYFKKSSMNINITSKHKIAGGDILKLSYLENFSTKYYQLLKNILTMGVGTAFIYSNFVEIGIQIVEEILLENGFLEYGDNHITPDTRCSHCGKKRSENHTNHTFNPAKFFTFTGQMMENEAERGTIIPKFNEPKNIDGSVIKLLLGSQVLSEGINLKSVRQVHIMDAHLNISRINQAIGRAVRYCSAVNLVSEDNPSPEIAVYKYSASFGSKLSFEEMIYRHAEIKFKLIKKINRVLQSISIDCPLNYQANGIKCDGAIDLWEKNQYKNLSYREVDKNTFHISLADKEIRNMKNSIKELYIQRLYYTLKEIKNLLGTTIREELFLYRALEQLTPNTDEKKNAYSELFVDNYNRLGYLIYRSGYFIFQQWMSDEYMPTYYRTRPPILPSQKTHLMNFLTKKSLIPTKNNNEKINDFESNITYYNKFPEGEYVGIIELTSTGDEIFKIRVRQKNSDFRRGKGIVSYKGAVCDKKSISWLLEACRALNIKVKNRNSRHDICAQLKEQLKKYEAIKASTYLILPANHPDFPINKKLNKKT